MHLIKAQTSDLDSVSVHSYKELNHLNIESKRLILDELDFPSLLYMAQVDLEFNSQAGDIYQQKFAEKTIRIGQRNEELDNAIDINDDETSMKLIEHFGTFIKKLTIDHADNSKTDEIIAKASRNCKGLEILSVNVSRAYNAFAKVQQPFESVTDVSIKCIKCKLSNEILNLNEMFPNMRKLSLNIMQLDEPQKIESRFANLKHLHLEYVRPGLEFAKSYEKTIMFNPQVQILKIVDSTTDFLEFISKNLPNLEHLDIGYIQRAATLNEILFASVKSLTVRSGVNYLSHYISFDQLEEFTSEYFGDVSEWINFLGRHSTVRKLTILNAAMYQRQLLTLRSHVPNLVEATLALPSGIPVDSIVKFINKLPQLKKLEAQFFSNQMFAGDKLTQLSKELQGSWTINKTEKGFLVEQIE